MDEKLNAALKGIYDNLTDEQKAKAKQCKTMEELTALASKAGVELPDEVLDAVAGGIGIVWEDVTLEECEEDSSPTPAIEPVLLCSDDDCYNCDFCALW